MALNWPVVVFDLDGTLVNTISLITASYHHAIVEVVGTAPDPAEAHSWIGEPLHETFGRCYPDQAEALVASYIAWNLANMEAYLEDYPGTGDLLAAVAAAGAAIGVATSKRRRSAERTLRAAGLAGLPVTVALEDTVAHKPDPEPLLLALERMGASPAAAVYVGDTIVDIQAARAAGMAAIGVTWGAGQRHDLLAAGPDAVVDTLADLQHLLLG